MLIYKKGPALLAAAILYLCLSQMSWAQTQSDLSPNSFPPFDDVLIEQSSQFVEYLYTLNGAEVTEEVCYAANDTQPGSCSVREFITRRGSFNAVTIPKFAAPFQVQLVTTKAFKSDADWKRAYPNIPLWDLRHVCGGTLIAENWVLTAAHCFKGVGPQPEKFGVRLDVGDLSDRSAQTIAIKDIILAEDYKNGVIGHDIALLRIETTGVNQAADLFNPLVDMKAGPQDIKQAVVLKGGKRFATLLNDNSLKLWSAKTGKALKQYPALYGQTVLDPDAGKLYAQDGNKVTRIDLATLRPDKSYDHGNIISEFQLLSGGQYLLVKGAGNHRFWNVKTGRKIVDIEDETLSSLKLVNAKRFLANFSMSDYGLFDLESGALIKTLKSRSLASPLIMPDGKEILMADGQILSHIDAQTGDVLAIFETSRDAASLEATSNGKYIIAEDVLGNIEIWNLEDGRKEATPKDRRGNVLRRTRATTSAKHIVISTYESVILWDIENAKVTYEDNSDRAGETLPALFFNNEKHVAIPNRQGVTQVLETKTGKVLFTINHSVPISHLRLSKGEDFILSYSHMGLAEVWDAKTGKAIERVFHGAPVAGLQLFNNDKSLLTWGSAKEAQLWKVRRGRASHSERGPRPLQSALNARSGRGIEGPSRVKPIKIAKGPIADDPKDTLLTFGWGKTRPVDGMEPSVLLRMMAFRKVPDRSCLVMISAAPEPTRQLSDALEKDTLFCARDNARKTCTGDSGGPVISGDTLIGVVSKGGYNCAADGKPGIYTRVGAYADWINKEMRKARPN